MCQLFVMKCDSLNFVTTAGNFTTLLRFPTANRSLTRAAGGTRGPDSLSSSSGDGLDVRSGIPARIESEVHRRAEGGGGGGPNPRTQTPSVFFGRRPNVVPHDQSASCPPPPAPSFPTPSTSRPRKKTLWPESMWCKFKLTCLNV